MRRSLGGCLMPLRLAVYHLRHGIAAAPGAGETGRRRAPIPGVVQEEGREGKHDERLVERFGGTPRVPQGREIGGGVDGPGARAGGGARTPGAG